LSEKKTSKRESDSCDKPNITENSFSSLQVMLAAIAEMIVHSNFYHEINCLKTVTPWANDIQLFCP
jgi:hypothetical protein